jgi:hypothetical protein
MRVPALRQRRGRATEVANRALMLPIRFAAVCLAAFACACAHGGTGTDAAPAPSATLPIVVGDYPAFGHAPDFSWIAGRIERSSPAGQCTYVQYSTHRGEPWGGRIALDAASSDVALFPTGDMVVVTGSLDDRALSACGEPALAVRTIAEH